MFFKKRTPQIVPFHFSVDDVFDAFIEVTDKKIPLFEHPFFSFLQEMHIQYNINVDLYLFFQKTIDGKLRTLREVRNIQDELTAAGNWIYFGPHALDYETRPHNQLPVDQEKVFDDTYQEIDRFAGSNLHAKWVRLHFYSESYELGDYFKKHGVEALMSTDRPAASYRMPDHIKQSLLQKGEATYQEANFIRTQFRLEFFVADGITAPTIKKLFQDAIQQYGQIILYTHEVECVKEETRDMLRLCLDIFKDVTHK